MRKIFLAVSSQDKAADLRQAGQPQHVIGPLHRIGDSRLVLKADKIRAARVLCMASTGISPSVWG
jgi:hypothetical protein